MTPQIATALYIIIMWGIFSLNRDKEVHTSKALWLPVIWLSIAASRSVSQWLAAFGFLDAKAALDSNDRLTPDQILDGSPLDRNVYIALLVVGLIVLFVRNRKAGALLRANGPILLFFGFCAVSVLWSDFPDVAFKRWIKAVGDLVMVMIVLTDPDGTSAVKRLLSRVGFVLVPVSVLFIKYYPDLGRVYDHFAFTPNYVGVTTGKNLLGMTVMIASIAGVWRFLLAFRHRDEAGRKGKLVAQGVMLLMAFWLFWMANSMTSLSCFLMAVVLLVVTNFDFAGRKLWVVHVLVVSMLCASFSTLFLDLGGAALETMGRNSTLTGRTEIWSLVIQLSGSPIFGTGFESFWLGKRLQKIWDLYWWHPNEAHDGYLEVYINLGWLGVTLFAIVLITGYRNVIRAFRRDPELGRVKLAYFVIALAYNFTESAVKTLNPVWIALLLASMAVPEETSPESDLRQDDTGTFADSEVGVQDKQLVGAKLRQMRA